MRTTLFILLFLSMSCSETRKPPSVAYDPPSDLPQVTNPHFDLPPTNTDTPTAFDPSDFRRTAKWLCIQGFSIDSFKDNQILCNQKRKDFFELVQSLRGKKINWSFVVGSVSEPNVVHFNPVEIEVDGDTCKFCFNGVPYRREKAISLRAGDPIRCAGTIRAIFYSMDKPDRSMSFTLASDD